MQNAPLCQNIRERPIHEKAYAMKKKENKGCCCIICRRLLGAEDNWAGCVEVFMKITFDVRQTNADDWQE